jgi:hypothetical protein
MIHMSAFYSEFSQRLFYLKIFKKTKNIGEQEIIFLTQKNGLLFLVYFFKYFSLNFSPLIIHHPFTLNPTKFQSI